ncbi:MAG: hypothetical protein AMXMBFR36_20450 [Acidobacteriota bacterium]
MAGVRVRRTCVLIAALVLAAGCAEAPPPVELRPVAAQLVPFLPDPTALSDPDSTSSVRWRELHAELLAGRVPSEIRRAAEIELARGAADSGGWLLVAETWLVQGDGEAALGSLGELPAELRGDDGVLLVEARARELVGPAEEAYGLYRRLSARSEAARQRGAMLEAEAVASVRRRFDAALERGRFVDAARELSTLEVWRPHDLATVRATLALAVARGDAAGELRALRELAARGESDLDSDLRRSRLEVELGDAQAGLTQLEALATARPGDPRVEDALDRARFRWRLEHAPGPVRAAAASAQVTRAQLARLIYWLVPGVRSARGGTARIASDVVGHEAHEEIVRVVNLGLLRVDETLHVFEPDRPARRGEALEALLSTAADSGAVCALEGQGLPGRWEGACAGAVACGWITDVAECLPGGPVSGAEVSDWIRRSTRSAVP